MDIWHNRATFRGLVGPIILALIWLLIGNLVGSSKTMLLVSSASFINILVGKLLVVLVFQLP